MKKRTNAIGEVEAATAAAPSESSSTQRLTQRASAFWKSYGQYIYSPTSPASHTTLGPRDLLNTRTLQDMNEEDADLKLLAQRHAKTSDVEESITLFPSYARERSTYTMSPESTDRSYEFLAQGWIYDASPPRQTRKNKFLFSAARQIVGLPSLSTSVAFAIQDQSSSPVESTAKPSSPSNLLGGDLSEEPSPVDDAQPTPTRSSLRRVQSLSRFVSLYKRTNSSQSLHSDGAPYLNRTGTDQSTSSTSSKRSHTKHFPDLDLDTCHENLTTRLAPFLRAPLRERFVKIQILDDGYVIAEQQVLTNDKGIFNARLVTSKSTTLATTFQVVASLEPQVRVKSQPLVECELDVSVFSKNGISLVSDIDDTIKHTAVTSGAREIFRNAFVRELASLQVEGVAKWYQALKSKGVGFHYVSNSPWQFWPTLREYLTLSDMPKGSVHLKSYNGVLAGIFEPAAERKRANMEMLFQDFPQRNFILVGDSGEQDLELYTELAIQFAPRILAVLIRDVSTPMTEEELVDAQPTASKPQEDFLKDPPKPIPPMLPPREKVTVPKDDPDSAERGREINMASLEGDIPHLEKQSNPPVNFVAAATTGHPTNFSDLAMKKRETWNRRLSRARQMLKMESCKTEIRDWRVGKDVENFCMQLLQQQPK